MHIINNLNHFRLFAPRLLAAALLLICAASALADVHYVDLNSTNATPPYTNWTTAATNIQDAVDVAVAGDEIVVTNGVYASGGRPTAGDTTMNRVAVDKPLSIWSVNGPQFTTIDGGASVRCVYLTNGVSASGFTLTHGCAKTGGGVFCASPTASVSNCVISASVAGFVARGGYYVEGVGGGAWGGTLCQCTLTGNSAGSGGGASGCTLFNCILIGNSASVRTHPGEYYYFGEQIDAAGGGADHCTLSNCTLRGNSAKAQDYIYYYRQTQACAYGGGASDCTLDSCTLSGNSASAVDLVYAFAFGGAADHCTLNNCVLTDNSVGADNSYFPDPGVRGGALSAHGGGASDCTLNNCTLTGNSATATNRFGSADSGSGGAYGTLNNCILFNNTSQGGCEDCGSPGSLVGNNCFGDPLFVELAAANMRLQSNSPCINAGNNAYAVGSTDLDGNPRIVGGTVDIGAYEFQAVRYVDVNCTNATPPYISWATAATNIRDALDVALAGDEIVVTNGIYDPVEVGKLVSVRSVNGPQFTSIQGGYFEGRCVSLTNGAVLSGFTLTAGHSWAGGGAYGGTLNNCTLRENSSDYYGGGAAYCVLNNCTLSDNSVSNSTSSALFGGGAYSCTLNDCTLTGNSAVPVYVGRVCQLWCSGGGQPVCCGGYITVYTLAYGGGAYSCTLNNCTLTHNSAGVGGGAYDSALSNCIIFANHDPHGCEDCDSPGRLAGNNWAGDPFFVDRRGWANLRLQSNSPCINAGNNSYVTSATDLDGNPRIAGGTVDIGAYEFQSPASQISYAWLQQFNLPIDPSTDTADPDADGVDNYHEWLAGTDPINPLSSPAQLAITPSGTDVILTWSTNAVGFTLQSTTNLASPSVWSTNSPAPVVIGGQNVVTNPLSDPHRFYRLIH